MATARKILIADPELEVVRSLSKALRQRGYQVVYAPDGSKALEMSVLRHPDVVLFDDECTLIDAKSFVNILASNPRTAAFPIAPLTKGVRNNTALRRSGQIAFRPARK